MIKTENGKKQEWQKWIIVKIEAIIPGYTMLPPQAEKFRWNAAEKADENCRRSSSSNYQRRRWARLARFWWLRCCRCCRHCRLRRWRPLEPARWTCLSKNGAYFRESRRNFLRLPNLKKDVLACFENYDVVMRSYWAGLSDWTGHN